MVHKGIVDIPDFLVCAKGFYYEHKIMLRWVKMSVVTQMSCWDLVYKRYTIHMCTCTSAHTHVIHASTHLSKQLRIDNWIKSIYQYLCITNHLTGGRVSHLWIDAQGLLFSHSCIVPCLVFCSNWHCEHGCILDFEYKLDYCLALLAGVSAWNLYKLQLVQSTLGCVVLGTRQRDHITKYPPSCIGCRFEHT